MESTLHLSICIIHMKYIICMSFLMEKCPYYLPTSLLISHNALVILLVFASEQQIHSPIKTSIVNTLFYSVSLYKTSIHFYNMFLLNS